LTDITAIYNGKAISDIPEDLFIPPEHLQIILEDFEGPLDLLLYLIKKQNIVFESRNNFTYNLPEICASFVKDLSSVSK